MRFIIVFLVVSGLFIGCKHELPQEQIIPVPTRLTVDISCSGCPTNPICPIVDDIQITTLTNYFVCAPTPSGQGSFVLDNNQCLIWTPSTNASEVVSTCIVACTGTVCDTTYVTVFPFGGGSSNPCSPDTVYFERDILPIFTAHCSFSGCHNQASASEGVVLDSYLKVLQTGGVKPGNPGDSDLFEAITETKPDKVMPPPPASRLTTEQISMIEKWIRQGAKNNFCDNGGCNTDNISYNAFVKPALSGCTTCHQAANQSGGVRLDTYAEVKAVAANGKLYGSISWQNGFSRMPSGGNKMNDCNISKIKSWIDAGSPEN
ncbi:MAG: hypothetical protein IPN79_17205 [Saprospiraceae bacterium]|nr:hypothetical protein [Saprospiraceae bacterium]